MNTRTIISIVLVSLGIIIAAIPANTTSPYKLTAKQMIADVLNKGQYFSPEEVADLLVNKDPSIQLIDIRSSAEYEKFTLPGSINIPFQDLLSEENRYLIDQDVKTNVLFSNGTLTADKAWMITHQLGYKNNYVLQGGLNYWAETIMNPSQPSGESPDEEIAKYDFRRAAANALGQGDTGDSLQSKTTKEELSTPKKPLIKRIKKKKVEGGC